MKGTDDILKEGMPFDRYTLVRRLGKGGMASVWLAKHTLLNTYFAIKFMDSDIAERDPEYIKRFLREARLAGKIHHPHIVGVYDVGRDKKTGLYYLVMEYVSGGNISQRLKHDGPFRERSAVEIVRQMAEALQEAQQYGMVHRDIKPDNIMFDAHGEAKLADLGIAKSTDPSETHLTQTEAVFGTPAYMSPEQARDSGKVDTRADIYSLGVVLFEMLSGKRPYGGKTVVEILTKIIDSTPPPDVRSVVTDVSDDTVDLVNTMIRKDPAERFQNADELLARIVAIEERLFGKTVRTTLTERSHPTDPVGGTTLPTMEVSDSGKTERTMPTLDTIGGETPADGKTMPTLDSIDGERPESPSGKTLPTMATLSPDESSPAEKTLPSGGKKGARTLLMGVAVFVAAVLTVIFLKPNRTSPADMQSPAVTKTLPRGKTEGVLIKEKRSGGSSRGGETSVLKRAGKETPAVSDGKASVGSNRQTTVKLPVSALPEKTPASTDDASRPTVKPSEKTLSEKPSAEIPVPSVSVKIPAAAADTKPSSVKPKEKNFTEKSVAASGTVHTSPAVGPAAKHPSSEKPPEKKLPAAVTGMPASGKTLPETPAAAKDAGKLLSVAAGGKRNAAGTAALQPPDKLDADKTPVSDCSVPRPDPSAGASVKPLLPAEKTPSSEHPDAAPAIAPGTVAAKGGNAVRPELTAPAVKDADTAVLPNRRKVELTCLSGTWPVNEARVLIVVGDEPPRIFERGPYIFEMPENGTYSVTVDAGKTQKTAWRGLSRRDCAFEAYPTLLLGTVAPVKPVRPPQTAAAAQDREVTLYCAVGPVPVETAVIRVMVSGRKPIVFTAAPYTFRMPAGGTFMADVGEGSEKGLRWKALSLKNLPYSAAVNVALERAPVKGFHVRFNGRELRRVSVEITASNMDRVREKNIPVTRLPQLIEECLAEDGRYKIVFSVSTETGSEPESFEFGFAAHGTDNLCFDLDGMQVLH